MTFLCAWDKGNWWLSLPFTLRSMTPFPEALRDIPFGRGYGVCLFSVKGPCLISINPSPLRKWSEHQRGDFEWHCHAISLVTVIEKKAEY